MKYYQDTQTGQIYAFEDNFDPLSSNNRNIPKTLVETIKEKPSDTHLWHEGGWIEESQKPTNYKTPISNVPPYNPAWMVHLKPYTAILREINSQIKITLDQINLNSYDGKKLIEVVGILDLGINYKANAFVSYDGTIAIPQNENFPDKISGINKLNEILSSILLGGIHAETLLSNELVIGSLHEKKFLFSYNPSINSELSSNFASISNRLMPLTMPRTLLLGDLQNAYKQGQQVIHSIKNLSPLFILNGYTAMMHHSHSDALNNLWISVEQLTEHLWDKKYIRNKNSFSIDTKKLHLEFEKNKQLNHIYAKQKILNKAMIITNDCHQKLEDIRKIRNKLVHNGSAPDSDSIKSLWSILPELIESSINLTDNLGMKNLAYPHQANWGKLIKADFEEWNELTKLITE